MVTLRLASIYLRDKQRARRDGYHSGPEPCSTRALPCARPLTSLDTEAIVRARGCVRAHLLQRSVRHCDHQHQLRGGLEPGRHHRNLERVGILCQAPARRRAFERASRCTRARASRQQPQDLSSFPRTSYRRVHRALCPTPGPGRGSFLGSDASQGRGTAHICLSASSVACIDNPLHSTGDRVHLLGWVCTQPSVELNGFTSADGRRSLESQACLMDGPSPNRDAHGWVQRTL